jgi:NUMOD3 motif
MRENTPRYWLGKKFSAEHRKKISEGHKGMIPKSAFKKGYVPSEATRRNLSIAIKKWWKRRKKNDKIQNSKRD